MTVHEARKMAEAFNENRNPSEEEVFLFTEAMNYLIEEEKNPADMMWLGGYYYEIHRFDLALKYYEMAAAMDFEEAYECLGYIWYYGRTGEKDYEKAFRYFSRLMEKGHLVATYKVADMYRNGYYVERDTDKYEEIIEELYPKVKNCRSVFDPIPEVYTRLARIRKAQGRTEDAINLYLAARNCLAQRISINAFFGNLNIMKWLIEDLYELIEFDGELIDLFDLYYLLKTPHRVSFFYRNGEKLVVESVMEGSECVINFNGRWFHNVDDFFREATIDGTKATALYRELYGFEVIANG